MKKKGGKSKKGRKGREEAGFFLASWLVSCHSCSVAIF